MRARDPVGSDRASRLVSTSWIETSLKFFGTWGPRGYIAVEPIYRARRRVLSDPHRPSLDNPKGRMVGRERHVVSGDRLTEALQGEIADLFSRHTSL
jgi:hypothetical protein